MKKKIWISLAVVLTLLIILFLPIPQAAYDDGGTREYVALTYKIVEWNKVSSSGVYHNVRIYFGEDKDKSVDELWEMECEEIYQSFLATVLDINGSSVLVQPLEGEPELKSSDKISFTWMGLGDINAEVGSVVEVTYTGEIMESYPAQIIATGWKLRNDVKKQ